MTYQVGARHDVPSWGDCILRELVGKVGNCVDLLQPCLASLCVRWNINAEPVSI
jgi:hypothetical protein